MRVENINNCQAIPVYKGKNIEQAVKLVKSPIKVLFSDIDNTILKNGEISEKHFNSIQQLINSGVKLIISTGRGYKMLDELFRKLGMQPEYAITSGGGTVVDKDLNKLRESTLSLDSMSKIIELSKQFAKDNIFLRFTFNGVPYFDNLKGMIIDRNSRSEYTDSYDKFVSENIMPTKAVFVIKPEPETFDDIKSLVNIIKKSLNSEDFNIVNSEKSYCEVMKSDASKGNAVKFLKEHLNIDYKNIACIGDAENDESMTNLISQNGGMSISMGNGTDKMKQISKFITSDINNFGFSKAVETILEINKNAK